LPETTAGGFVVQLISIRSRDRARPAWAKLQKAHPALLGNRELSIQKADLGDRGVYYRVRAGFFAERASASDFCNALKTRGQDCLVTKR
jgi:cell division septation protein DedD